MATYDQLKTQYDRLKTTAEKNAFLAAHPRFREKLGGDAYSGSDFTQGSQFITQNLGGNWEQFTYGSTTYYRNKQNGRVLDASGTYIGHWRNGQVVDFSGNVVGAPGPGGTPSPVQPPAETPTEEEDEDEEDDETAERPPRPAYSPGAGNEWTWDEATQSWKPTRTEQATNDLYNEWKSALSQFGFEGDDVEGFIAQALKENWSEDTFTIKMRQADWYLANPLFAANIERKRQGKRFLNESEVLDHAANVRALAKQYGYSDVPDSYIAASLISKASDPSQMLAQMNHQLMVNKRVEEFGGGVAVVYREIMGHDPSDLDLYELFDPAIDTSKVDAALRQAEYRGRPLTLGLGIRTEAEARAAEMLGITPDEWFSRFENVAQNKSRFDRLRSIEDLITQGLPNDFGSFMADLPNDLLRDALVFQRPDALQKLQSLTSKEIARFRGGGGVTATQGQLTGLLTDEQRASYG